MPFDATAVEILIASPSDVLDERDIAVEVIADWNRSYSLEQRVVLLPRRWETHSAPELGDRPQEVVNRQVVDQCDLVIAIFWTRLGTPTGIAESGTVEEIERCAERGKLAMVYFSRSKIDPARIDLEEMARLRTFEGSMRQLGLVETFTSTTEFREKLRHQIDQQVRTLIAKSAQTKSAEGLADDLNLRLGVEAVGIQGEVFPISVVTCPDLAEVPDYKQPQTTRSSVGGVTFGSDDNANYYRELVRWYMTAVGSWPAQLTLRK